MPLILTFPFPTGGSDSKESACNVGALSLIPGSGRSPGEVNSYPLQYSCLENPMAVEPGGLWSVGSQRVRHYWGINTFTFPYPRPLQEGNLYSRPVIPMYPVLGLNISVMDASLAGLLMPTSHFPIWLQDVFPAMISLPSPPCPPSPEVPTECTLKWPGTLSKSHV